MSNNVINPQNNGFLVKSGAQFFGRQLIAGSNISISNPDGIAGDPTISYTGASGGYTLITSTTLGAPASQVNFNDASITTYNELLFIFRDIFFSSGTTNFRFRFSDDNLSTFENVVMASNVDSSTNNIMLLADGTSTGAPSNSACGWIRITNQASPPKFNNLFLGTYRVNGGGNARAGTFYSNVTTRFNSFRFDKTAGSFDEGTFILYGK